MIYRDTVRNTKTTQRQDIYGRGNSATELAILSHVLSSSRHEISAHSFIILSFTLADNSGKKITAGDVTSDETRL